MWWRWAVSTAGSVAPDLFSMRPEALRALCTGRTSANSAGRWECRCAKTSNSKWPHDYENAAGIHHFSTDFGWGHPHRSGGEAFEWIDSRGKAHDRAAHA